MEVPSAPFCNHLSIVKVPAFPDACVIALYDTTSFSMRAYPLEVASYTFIM
jgi:hypothetical protein